MPNILETLSHELPQGKFETHLHDLVAFLAYVSEPEQPLRLHMGFFVVGFLLVLFFLVLGLKTVYWRKIGGK